MNVTATVIITTGLEAVVLLAVRAYAHREAWWHLLASLLPLALIAGLVLTLLSTPN